MTPLCAGYLLGSIPTGYLVGRVHGVDIRQHGSGNIGATNVYRTLGRLPGIFVFVCDALKGWFAVWLAVRVANDCLPAGSYVAWLGIIAALACILGHNYPLWLAFRGGKGVATTIGVLLGLMPAAVLIGGVIWVIVFICTRYVSLASLVAAATLPVTVASLQTEHDPKATVAADPMFWFSVAATVLIFVRHRANIGRLLRGNEARFGRKAPHPVPPP